MEWSQNLISHTPIHSEKLGMFSALCQTSGASFLNLLKLVWKSWKQSSRNSINGSICWGHPQVNQENFGEAKIWSVMRFVIMGKFQNFNLLEICLMQKFQFGFVSNSSNKSRSWMPSRRAKNCQADDDKSRDNSNWAPFLSNKKSQVWFDKENLTSLWGFLHWRCYIHYTTALNRFFAKKNPRISNTYDFPIATPHMTSTMKMWNLPSKCLSTKSIYLFYFLPYPVMSSVHVLSKIVWHSYM